MVLNVKYMLLMNFVVSCSAPSRTSLTPCPGSGPSLDLEHHRGSPEDTLVSPERLLQDRHDGLGEGPWLVLPCLLCSDNPAAAVGVSL